MSRDRAMDSVYVDCELRALQSDARAVTARSIAVEPDSLLTWLPAELLSRAGVTVAKEDIWFVMANGETVRRSTGYAIVRASGFETVDEAVFGQPGDLALLGSRTIEGFGARVDAEGKRLVAAGPRLAT